VIRLPNIQRKSSLPANAPERDDESNEPDPSQTRAILLLKHSTWDSKWTQIRLPNQLQTRYLITTILQPSGTTEQDWIGPLSPQNGLPNGITRGSRDNFQTIITEISQRRISLIKDFTWRSTEWISGRSSVPIHWPRCLPNGVRKNQETIAKRHAKLNAQRPYPRPMKWPAPWQRIFNWSCLPKWPKRFQTRTQRSHHLNDFPREATHPDPAKSKDAKICICNVQSVFPRAEVHFYHGEYDHIMWSVHVRYVSMICRQCPMQLASILPPSNCHEWARWELTALMIPAAEAHITVQCQDEIHVIINNFTDQSRWWSILRLNFVW